MSEFLRRRSNTVAVAVAAAVFIAALALIAATGVGHSDSSAQTFWQNGPSVAGQPVSGPDFAPVAAKLRGSLVRIIVEGQPTTGDTIPGDPSGTLPPGHPSVPAEGTGLIINDMGYILTNRHVIADATKITVTLAANGRRYAGRVVGSDAAHDLALVKIDTKDKLTVAALGNSDAMRPGNWVMAMGNPLGYDFSVTVGVISGQNRSLPGVEQGGLIQTDASIDPGNSGGPLVNLSGEVVGINTALIPNTRLGFAVPINAAKQAIPRMLQRGK